MMKNLKNAIIDQMNESSRPEHFFQKNASYQRRFLSFSYAVIRLFEMYDIQYEDIPQDVIEIIEKVEEKKSKKQMLAAHKDVLEQILQSAKISTSLKFKAQNPKKRLNELKKRLKLIREQLERLELGHTGDQLSDLRICSSTRFDLQTMKSFREYLAFAKEVLPADDFKRKLLESYLACLRGPGHYNLPTKGSDGIAGGDLPYGLVHRHYKNVIWYQSSAMPFGNVAHWLKNLFLSPNKFTMVNQAYHLKITPHHLFMSLRSLFSKDTKKEYKAWQKIKAHYGLRLPLAKAILARLGSIIISAGLGVALYYAYGVLPIEFWAASVALSVLLSGWVFLKIEGDLYGKGMERSLHGMKNEPRSFVLTPVNVLRLLPGSMAYYKDIQNMLDRMASYVKTSKHVGLNIAYQNLKKSYKTVMGLTSFWGSANANIYLASALKACVYFYNQSIRNDYIKQIFSILKCSRFEDEQANYDQSEDALKKLAREICSQWDKNDEIQAYKEIVTAHKQYMANLMLVHGSCKHGKDRENVVAAHGLLMIKRIEACAKAQSDLPAKEKKIQNPTRTLRPLSVFFFILSGLAIVHAIVMPALVLTHVLSISLPMMIGISGVSLLGGALLSMLAYHLFSTLDFSAFTKIFDGSRWHEVTLDESDYVLSGQLAAKSVNMNNTFASSAPRKDSLRGAGGDPRLMNKHLFGEDDFKNGSVYHAPLSFSQ